MNKNRFNLNFDEQQFNELKKNNALLNADNLRLKDELNEKEKEIDSLKTLLKKVNATDVQKLIEANKQLRYDNIILKDKLDDYELGEEIFGKLGNVMKGTKTIFDEVSKALPID